jgi:hypothetical protein
MKTALYVPMLLCGKMALHLAGMKNAGILPQQKIF